jgi:hypothetical protein
MCDSILEGGRRCPCSSPERRSAVDRARYAAKKAAGATNPPKDGGGIAVLERPAPQEPTVDEVLHEAISLARQHYGPTMVNRVRDSNVIEQIEAHESAIDAINERYGTAEAAVTKAGAILAAKGEEYAGITAIQVQQSWEQRKAAAQEAIDVQQKEVDLIADKLATARQAQTDAVIAVRDAGGTSSEISAERSAHSPAIMELQTALMNARGDIGYVSAKVTYTAIHNGQDHQTKADLRRLSDGYAKALAEVRDIGGLDLALNAKSTKESKRVFNEAAQIFPKNWIEASNGRSAPIAKVQASRAHYMDSKLHHTKKKMPVSYITRVEPGTVPEDSMYYTHEPVPDMGEGYFRRFSWETTTTYNGDIGAPRGTGWERYETNEGGTTRWRRQRHRMEMVSSEAAPEIKTSKKIPTMDGRDEAFATSSHELGHRFEYSVPGIMSMEQDFLIRRTTTDGERDKLQSLGAGMKGERARPDSFANAYMGKEYNHSGAKEVLSCGTEALFAGRYGGLVGVGAHKPDHDMRNFILGVFATAERPEGDFVMNAR